MAKRAPAAAICQNQKGMVVVEESDLPLLLLLEEEELDEPVWEELEEPEVAVGWIASDAAALAAASVDVTFKLKLVTENVTFSVECQVSDPN